MAKSKKTVKKVPEPADTTQPVSEVPEEISTEDKNEVVETPLAEAENSLQVDDSEKPTQPPVNSSPKNPNKWLRFGGLAVGVPALVTLVVSGVASQYFKGRVMPGVSVAGVASTAKTPDQVKRQLEAQKQQLKVTFKAGDKTLQPKLEEIGYQVDSAQTVKNALAAKRQSGILAKIAFWSSRQVPASVTINDTLLNQYLETNLPDFSKAPQDAQLEFNAKESTFSVSVQADGQGPNVYRLKKSLNELAGHLKPSTFKVGISRKGPTLTEAKLQPLVEPANELVARTIVLTGLGYTYRAKPADIATWITPTPQADGTVKLIVDSAKIQSYVEGIGKKISSPPQDRKIVKDSNTGAEVVIQEGRNGTELADRQTLANAIAQSLKDGQDTTQTMKITTAAYKTVNMEAYDKWIEVDLSEQRTTAYERATPIRSFVVATGVRGNDTPVGEFAIWLRVRVQTMQGGSKADGSYYSIPNVEWVSYFYKDYALHGAWWREVFGRPASHGCVNMTNADAQWVFEWAPLGTKVIVHA